MQPSSEAVRKRPVCFNGQPCMFRVGNRCCHVAALDWHECSGFPNESETRLDNCSFLVPLSSRQATRSMAARLAVTGTEALFR